MDCGHGTAAAGVQGSGELDGGASCMPIPPVPIIPDKTAFLKEKLVLARRKAASEFSSAVEPGLRPREDSHRSQCLPSHKLEVQSGSHPVDSSGSSPSAPVPRFTDPEALARYLLEHQVCLTAESALNLIELLPKAAEEPLRQAQSGPGRRFSFGVYKHGGIVGLHRNTNVFPSTCKALNLLLLQVCPSFKYSSLAVHVDVKSGLHRDAQNREGPNLIVPLSRFSGGELWFQTSQGVENSESDPSIKGCLIPIADGPAFLMNPSVPHETRDWTGTRVVLIAYSVFGSERLASDMTKVIEPLGFSIAPQGLGPFRVSWDPRSPPPLKLPSSEVSKEVPKSVSDMFFVEITSGSAEVTKAAAAMGFRPFAVSVAKPRGRREPVVAMDLTDPLQVESLIDFLRAEYNHVACVFISPPAGTASLLRERSFPSLESQCLKLPKQLRSAQFPDGLPNLSGRDKLCVERANQLFQQLAVIACESSDLGILTVIENPANSRYWETSFFESVEAHVSGHVVTFHSCVHGGCRPKLVKLWSNQDSFSSLTGRCDGSHRHKPWIPVFSRKRKVSFATADEPFFPPLLVERFLHCVVRGSPELTFGPKVLAEAVEQPSAVADGRLRLGLQPRGNALPQIVWEFDETLDFIVPVQSSSPLDKALADLPKGARVFSRQLCQWGSLQCLLDRESRQKPTTYDCGNPAG